MIEISDKDISEIEQVMGIDFDAERRQVIKSMESQDVLACPGSGKTTTLVAKVGVLTKKIPPSCGEGICVLSHTNVAWEEIQSRLNRHIRGIGSYPHFIGTIQSFVDKFLAIPAMVELYGIRPTIIDDDTFASIAQSRRSYLPKKVKKFLDNKPTSAGRLGNIRYAFEDRSLCWLSNGQEKNYLKDPTKLSYQKLYELKEVITQSGCIAYHDAFALANYYLNQHPELAQVIARRFRYVFVDEAQDTDRHQWSLLNRVFQQNSIFQRFGDANQAIFVSGSTRADTDWDISVNHLTINKTHRFSTSIAQLCESVATVPQIIEGKLDLPECSHTIFLFEETEEVIPAFADLINEHRLEELGHPLKVVGMVKDHKSELSLTSYHQTFLKSNRRPEEQDSLRAYFSLARESIANNNAGEAQRWLQKGMVKLARLQSLKESGGRTYSRSTLIVALEDKSRTLHRDIVLNWITAFASGKQLQSEEVVGALQQLFTPLVGQENWTWTAYAKDFIQSAAQPHRQTAEMRENYYQGKGCQIMIDTIHGVKGETHTATLLVDTYNRTNHLKSILPYLLGSSPQNINKYFVRLAYVAMSRPKYLLALAMRHSDISSEDMAKLEKRGWSIKKI